MQERNFWLLLSLVIIVLSGILILVIGYIYFVVIPRPRISTTTLEILPTGTTAPSATKTIETQATNTPFFLNIVTSTPTTEDPLQLTRTASPTVVETDFVSPTKTGQVTPAIAGSPQEFIRSYYELINQHQYNTAFDMLSVNFKDRFHCCNPDGSYQIEPYIDWWDSIKKVTVLSISTNPSSDQTVQVTVTLRYLKKNGDTIQSTHTFDLVFDRSQESWLID